MASVLVIDDNPANLELMTYLLHAFGHSTFTAVDGRQGIELAVAEPVDLVICDIHMPIMDGYAVAEYLRALPTFRQIPLVAVTALAMVGDRDKALAVGFDGYITKPLDPERFVGEIEQFLPLRLRTSDLPLTSTFIPQDDWPESPKKNVRLLVVADMPTNQELARAVLEPSGYKLVIVASVQAALTALSHQSFELVLSDLHKPEVDGVVLLDAIRAAPSSFTVPILLLSSSTAMARELASRPERGTARLLLRPIEPQQLLAEVAACLHHHKES